MLVPAPDVRPVRSTLLSVTDKLPATSEGVFVPWQQDGFHMAKNPTQRGVIDAECLCPIGFVSPPEVVGEAPTDHFRWHAFDLKLAMQWATTPLFFNAHNAGNVANLSTITDHWLSQDEAFLMSQAIQLGVICDPLGASDAGLATITTAPIISDVGTEMVLTGGPVSMLRGISELLEWWAFNGSPGQAVMHVPACLQPFFASERQIEISAQGPLTLPGGMAAISFGPGYMTRVGPRGTIAPLGSAWIWISGRIYAEVADNTVKSATKNQTGASFARSTRRAIYAFDVRTVAAALVAIP